MADRATRWYGAELLRTPEGIEAALNAAFEEGDPLIIQDILGDIARTRGMSEVSRSSGVARQALYKALDSGGNPSFSTVLSVLNALGITLKINSIAA